MRLDVFVAQTYCDISRQKALDLIKQGQVAVNNVIVSKPSLQVCHSDTITIKQDLFIDSKIYCSRAALKLHNFFKSHQLMEQTLELIQNTQCDIINTLESLHKDYTSLPNSKQIAYIKNYLQQKIYNGIVLDVGASAGGFTQILLTLKAHLVVAQDVGTLQLDSLLQQHKRVISIENLDIRDFARKQSLYATHILERAKSLTPYTNNHSVGIPQPHGEYCIMSSTTKYGKFKLFDCLVCDVSFISLTHILSSLLLLSDCMLLLFKPQFEVGIKARRNKRGVVLDSKIIQKTLKNFIHVLHTYGAKVIFIEKSFLKGKMGNEEFFIFCQF